MEYPSVEVECRGRIAVRSGEQGIARVVDDALRAVAADPALHLHGASRSDARDLASAEPDQRDGVRTVEELRLERRHATARAQGHVAQGAAQPDRCAVGALGDQVAAPRPGRLAELPGVLV